MSVKHRNEVPEWLAAAAIVVLTLLAYVPVLSAGFIWDDDAYVTANRALRSLDGLRRIWFEPSALPQYYPLVFTSFWIEYHAWGAMAAGYHVVNVLMHAVTAVLLWRILARLELPGAWLGAALFALHPVQVESVAWITERKNVLSGLFYMAAALFYLGSARRWPRYAAALACFAAALLSKTVTCSLPAALLLVSWWQQGRLTRKEAQPLVPFFAIAVVFALMTVQLEQQHVGAIGADWDLSLVQRLLIAGRAVWFYAYTLIWPATLTFIYPRWQIDPTSWWQYAFPLVAVAVLVSLFVLRHRFGRGPLAAVLFFTGTLFPALGFINVFPMRYSFVADHFQYLASIGLIVLATVAVTRWQGRQSLRGVSVAVLAMCAILSFRQARIYANAETIWRDTLNKNPAAWMAHNNLGLLLFQRGDHAGAVTEFTAALRIKPDDAYADNNIGNVLAQDGDLDGALRHFREAVRIEPFNAEAHGNIGNVLAAQGDWSAASAAFSEAIRVKPGNADAHSNLGNVLALQGKSDDAIAHYRSALAADPDFAAAHHNLAVLLAQSNRIDEAIAHWQAAIALDPHAANSHASLGMVLAERGQRADAIAHLMAALRAQPDNDQVRQQLDALRQERR